MADFGIEPWLVTPPASSTGEIKNAYDQMLATLKQWGLEQLAPDVLKLLQDGHAQDQIPVLLQQTEAYKKRFVGNEARLKAGLGVLSPAEYLSVERSYRQILESQGMPKGFYDSTGDFANWIGSDVSPQEIQTRVGYAADAAEKLDEGTKRAFQEFYGVGKSDLAAFFLDRDRALPHLQKIAKATQIGAAGFNQGVGFNKNQAEHLAESTIVGSNQVEQAVSTVAELGRDVGKLGQLYGGPAYNNNTASEEVFFDNQQAKKRRTDLSARERGEFAGNAGVGRTSLTSQSGLY